MKKQPISNSKPVQNLLVVLKAKMRKQFELYRIYKEEKYLTSYWEIKNIVTLIENKSQLHELATIYDVELLKWIKKNFITVILR